MKILGGKFKGRNFYMPEGIRPTQSILRKAVFDILGDMEGLDVLELFAGSGAIGLEALSRGAQHVTFVDKNAQSIATLEENVKLLLENLSFDELEGSKNDLKMEHLTSKVEILIGDALARIKHLAAQKRKFDIVFLDPPFEENWEKKALNCLGVHDILQPNCLILIQVGKKESLPQTEGRLCVVREKNYGASKLVIYQLSDQ